MSPEDRKITVHPPDFLRLMRDTKGVIAKMARSMYISVTTVKRLIRENPEFERALLEIQAAKHDTMVDDAETLLQYFMSNYKENPERAFKAACKVLDGIGKKRGWGPRVMDDDKEKRLSEDILDMVQHTNNEYHVIIDETFPAV